MITVRAAQTKRIYRTEWENTQWWVFSEVGRWAYFAGVPALRGCVVGNASGQSMEEKETFRDAVLRGLTWTVIFTALAVFWGAVVIAVVAWFR